MSWCTFCRQERSIYPGEFCPSCGNRTTPSTDATIHASALTQITENDSDIQVVEVIRQQPTVVYYQTPSPPPLTRSRSRRKVQTIEKTGKFWKAHMMLAFVVAASGLVMLLMGRDDGIHGPTTFAWVGGIATVVGMAWFAFARAGAWWNHG